MIKGIDVSHYQGKIDWVKVASSGVTFAIMKATDGANYQDPTFRDNMDGATRAGLICGAYHFFRPLDTVADQVINFTAALKGADFPLLLALDLEDSKKSTTDDWATLDAQKRAEIVNAWLDAVQERYRGKPLVYTDAPFADRYLQEVALGCNPLWLARYAPTVPQAWQEWKLWQFSPNGAVPGIIGPVDQDQFNGDQGDLASLMVKGG